MQTAYIQLGKAGDILSLLPILKQVANGSPANLIVSAKYASVAEGLPHIRLHVWDGDWTDLRGCLKWAKQRFQRVIVPQTFGERFPIQHRTPSFQNDQLVRTPCAEDRDSLTLELPRSDNAVQLVQAHIKGRTILVADHSESSPFPHREELMAALKQFESTHTIIRLSEIKLESIRDFLALYDAAELLISIETAHLHLSKASKVPTIALATDVPERWHGSTWSKRFAFYCRYGEFKDRIEEFTTAMRGVVEKKPQIQIEAFTPTLLNAYNPSILKWNNSVVGVFRFHPDRTKWRTQLAVRYELKTFVLESPLGLEEHSLEDPRLFILDGRLHMAFVASTFPAKVPTCAMLYAPLIQDGDKWKIGEVQNPEYGNNDFSGMQKNWVPFAIGKNLYFIYGSQPKQIVIQVQAEKVIQAHTSDSPKWAYGEIRGGAVVERGEHLLRFFHSSIGDSHRNYHFRYFIGAALMETRPPFRTVKVSRQPILAGNEMWVRDCPSWKPNVVFPGGVVKDGDLFRLSYGANDCRCMVATLKMEDLNL